MINKDYYTSLKNSVETYLKFGKKGQLTLRDIKKFFYIDILPENVDIKPAQVYSFEAKLASLHANASYELTLAEAALNLANKMYEKELSAKTKEIMDNFQNKRLPAAEKIRIMAAEKMNEEVKLQKLYAQQAVNVMKRVINHLDFVASRLKNTVRAMKVDAFLEKGLL